MSLDLWIFFLFALMCGHLRATNECHFSFWCRCTCHVTFILLFIDLGVFRTEKKESFQPWPFFDGNFFTLVLSFSRLPLTKHWITSFHLSFFSCPTGTISGIERASHAIQQAISIYVMRVDNWWKNRVRERENERVSISLHDPHKSETNCSIASRNSIATVKYYKNGW